MSIFVFLLYSYVTQIWVARDRHPRSKEELCEFKRARERPSTGHRGLSASIIGLCVCTRGRDYTYMPMENGMP